MQDLWMWETPKPTCNHYFVFKVQDKHLLTDVLSEQVMENWYFTDGTSSSHCGGLQKILSSCESQNNESLSCLSHT